MILVGRVLNHLCCRGLHFLGRLARPFTVIATQDAGAWLGGHAGGCVVAAYRKDPPPGLGEPAFRQDYRGQSLGIWLAP